MRAEGQRRSVSRPQQVCWPARGGVGGRGGAEGEAGGACQSGYPEVESARGTEGKTLVSVGVAHETEPDADLRGSSVELERR